jgi:4-amino-4-deoxy-L-arabinose transferase-like glycosyltransferase
LYLLEKKLSCARVYEYSESELSTSESINLAREPELISIKYQLLSNKAVWSMKKLFGRLENSNRNLDWVVLTLVFALGLALRFFYIKVANSDPTKSGEDPYYYSLIAQNLLDGRGFIEGGARAYRPPAFPWFLAGSYSIVGGASKVVFAQLFLAVLGALHPVLTALWVREISTRRVGYFAAIMTAVHPQFIRYPQTLYTEAFYLFLLSLAMLFLLRAVRSNALIGFVLAGVTFGLAALTREVTLIIPFLVAIWFYLLRNKTIERGGVEVPARINLTRNWLVLTCIMAVTVLPWTVRNYGIFKTLVPISTNSGINFYIGNNPNPNWSENFSWKVAPGVQWRNGAGELQAHQKGQRAAIDYIKNHPLVTVRGWFQKAAVLWMPPINGFSELSLPLKAMRAAWLVFYLFALGLGIYGFLGIRVDWRAASLPLIIGLGFSLPYILSFVTSRFRLPMESVLLFYSALGLERVLSLRLEGRQAILLNSFWLRSRPNLLHRIVANKSLPVTKKAN